MSGVATWDEIMWPVLNVENPKYPQLGKRLGPYYAQGVDTPIYIEVGQRVKLPKQAQFMWAIDHYDEVGYGGAAGPGKSYSLLKSHIYKHIKWMRDGITGVNTGMFCETLKDVERRHTEELPKLFPRWLGRYNDSKKIFYFKKKWGGGKIYFCNTDDPEKYRSVQFAYMTVDECTQIDETTYEDLQSRLRWPGISDLCLASATNPGGIGHNWYLKRLVDQKSDRIVRPVYDEEYGEWSRGSFFIQALPDENPFLTKQYYMTLNRLPEKKKNALKKGLWDTFDGQFFEVLTPSIHRIKRFSIPDEWPKFLAVDLGGSHPCGAIWAAVAPPDKKFPEGRIICYRYYEQIDKDVAIHKRNIASLTELDKNYVGGTGGHDMWSHKHFEEGQKTPAQRFNNDDEFGIGLNLVEAPRDRKNGWRLVNEYLGFEGRPEVQPDGAIRYNMQRYPKLYFFSDLELLWDGLVGVVHKKTDSEDLQKSCGNQYEVGEGDEAADCVRYLLTLVGTEDLADHSERPSDKKDPYKALRNDQANLSRNPRPYSRF